MARWMGLGLVVVVLFTLAAPARAGVCFFDNPPAATLLLPYFEVDLSRPTGRTTLRRQAWVGTVSSANGRFSVGYNATPLDSLCSPP